MNASHGCHEERNGTAKYAKYAKGDLERSSFRVVRLFSRLPLDSIVWRFFSVTSVANPPTGLRPKSGASFALQGAGEEKGQLRRVCDRSAGST